MKRIMILTLCAICGWAALQAQYNIDYCSGNVKFKTNGSETWQKAEVDISLQDNDILWLHKGCSVRVEVAEQGNYKVYHLSDAEQHTMSQWIAQAKKKNSLLVMKGLNTKFNTGMTQTMAHTMAILGGISRGFSLDESEPMDTLSSYDYKTLAEQLAWIGAQACSGAESPVVNGIAFIRKPVGKELEFEFYNQTDKNYYMNILHVNKRTGLTSLCYVIIPEEPKKEDVSNAPDVTSMFDVVETPNNEANSCPITPSGFSTCFMEMYFPNTSDDVYVLVAMDKPYDTYELDNELYNHPIDKAQNSNIDIKYMWNYETYTKK